MPLWLTIVLGVLGALASLLAIVRAENDRQLRLLKAELGVTLAEHIADCPARARAYPNDDDSGEVTQARHWSPSGRLVVP